MTAPDPRALLDALDEAHAKATPGPWRHAWFDVVEAADHGVIGAARSADAAAIVAAVNALPALTAAVRTTLTLADDLTGAANRFRARHAQTGDSYDEGAADALDTAARRLRSTVPAALTGGQA